MFRYRDLTQTEARAKLKAVAAGLPAPKPTRAGYDKPDPSVKQTFIVRALRSAFRRTA